MASVHIRSSASEGQSCTELKMKCKPGKSYIRNSMATSQHSFEFVVMNSSNPEMKETNLLFEPWAFLNCCFTQHSSLTVSSDGCVIMHFFTDIKPSLTLSITLKLPSREFPQYIKFLT